MAKYGPQYEVGRYYGRVTRQAMGEAKTGNPQFVLSFVILGKVNLADPEGELLSCPQGERSIYRTITEGTIQFVIEDLQALGYTKPSFKYLDPATPGFVDFAGKELEFFCSHETDNRDGNLREKWGIARAKREIAPLDAKKARNLDALYGKQLKSLAADATPSTAAVAGRTPATMTEPPAESNGVRDANAALQEAAAEVDDIPFSLLPFLVALSAAAAGVLV